jgi:hypothetical protein
LVAFFLHYQACGAIAERYPVIFDGKRSDKEQKAANKSGIDNFGNHGLIFEVAKDGVYGTIEEVKKVNMWDFYFYLAYIRTLNKYERISNE